MVSQMESLEPRVLTVDDFLALQTVSTTERQPTIFQSFKRMARDFDRWLRTNPRKISFNCFARQNNYEINDKNKSLYVFLFLREDKELMSMWEREDLLGLNRVNTNTFLKVTYPGTTKEEKRVSKW